MNFYLRFLSVFTATIFLSQSFPLRMTGNTWGSGIVMAQTIGDRKEEVLRLLDVGIKLEKAGQFREALAAFEKALAITREAGDRNTEGLALMSIGRFYADIREYPKALDYYQQALNVTISTKNKDIEGKTRNNIGLVYLNLQQYNTALEYYQQALAIAKQIGDERDTSIRTRGIGLVYYKQGEYPKALHSFNQALAIAQKTADKKGEGVSLGNIGAIYKNQGQYAKALETYNKALAIYQKINDTKKIADTLSSIGEVYFNQKQYSQALKYQQQNLAIRQKNRDKNGETLALVGIGNTYLIQKQYPQSLDYYQKGLLVAKQNGRKSQEILTLSNIGLLYQSQGNFPKALKFSKSALIIAQQMGNAPRENELLLSIGKIYALQEKYAIALEHYQKSLIIAQKFGYQARQAHSLNAIGVIYRQVGQYRKALNIYQQALDIYKKIGEKEGEGRTLNNIGVAHNGLGKHVDAEKSYQLSLEIAKQTGDKIEEGITLKNLGLAYHYQHKFSEALNHYNQALAIAKQFNDKAGGSTTLHNIGGIYLDTGNYPKALESYQKSLAMTKEMGSKEWESLTLNNAGEAYTALGKYSEAENTLFSAIEARESLRDGLKDDQKISIFEQQSDSYRSLQKALVAQNKIDKALEISERGRARAFVELLASKQSQYTENKQNTKPNIQQIKQVAQNQKATIIQYSIVPSNVKYLQKGEKQEFRPSQESVWLYIWVIKPTGEITFKQVDLKSFNTSLKDLVINSRDSLGVRSRDMFEIKVINPQPEDPTEELKQLHKILIGPIANLLPKDPNEKVIFIPQESLFLVPFPALLDDKGKYLIEKHTILTAPSIQVLDLTRKQKQNSLKIETSDRNTALVVGNPTMPKIKIGDLESNLKPLPGSQKEALKIAKFLNIEALTGNKATKSSIMQKMEQASIIHLATHGLLHDFKGFGVPGAIALAPSGNKNDSIDGLLTASEILDMKLKADLVVLSACDTGRGTITGDGVIGLSRSLFSAGVPSVIVSLWAVDDDSTAFLMTEFYQNLLNKQKPLNKAQALRQAMLTTMKQKEYSNPLHWAAFTLIGEAE
jgi:CHAT domain-containing protein/Flp pilus assembly protein TadD